MLFTVGVQLDDLGTVSLVHAVLTDKLLHCRHVFLNVSAGKKILEENKVEVSKACHDLKPVHDAAAP